MAGSDQKQKKHVSMATVLLAIVAVAAIIAAVMGWARYENARVPETAAAKVNDAYIDESDVASAINQYRIGYNLTDDGDFASALLQQNLNVSSFRQNIINQKALNLLVDQRAQELGAVPSDDDVQAQVDQAKQNMAFNDDDVWSRTLDQYGMTQDDVFAQYKNNLERQAVLEKDVPRRDPSDDYTLSYAQQNLAGVSQKHAYRIMFTGDDASTRADECSQQIKQAAADGTLSSEYFSELARQYSDEDNVAETGGSFAWSVQVSNDDDLSQVLDSINVGEASQPSSISSDDATEILYCDDSYTFPDSSSISDLKAEDVPSTLWDQVKQKAADNLWESDCSSYLAQMLAQAQITYYPVPQDAAYNVDMSNASTSTSNASDSSDSSDENSSNASDNDGADTAANSGN